MGQALGFAETEGDDNTQLFALPDEKGRFDFAVGHGNPAGIQPQLLGFQYQTFPVITAGFLQGGTFLPDHGDVVGDTAEFAVMRHKAGKSPWLVGDKLDMQPAFFVAGGDLISQCRDQFFVQRFVLILADTVVLFPLLAKEKLSW